MSTETTVNEDKQQRLKELDLEFCRQNFHESVTEAEILERLTDEHRKQLVTIHDEIGAAHFCGPYRVVSVYYDAIIQPQLEAARAYALGQFETVIDLFAPMMYDIARDRALDCDDLYIIGSRMEKVVRAIHDCPALQDLFSCLFVLCPEYFRDPE